ncbi:trimethylamine methyltransferase family protein [Pseudohalocynthiibacter aestuariivivens]|jgi:trimethylamine---corrinoid protein Co-methyltransferase|uniref:Methyltransferase n=1 Tax=Pseudohalocynthiibacter aestuariivivens TaxID=1591409 RepID=A0ABV5JCA6_9RHOB|nr:MULTISPECIES: trimethylamine methyltransferase family protein [Pseudohalocynthiibacter]MCK0104599.1 trimethylamine methyltransferase family protein [Pseudohalocynthiibacter sp. F2068]
MDTVFFIYIAPTIYLSREFTIARFAGELKEIGKMNKTSPRRRRRQKSDTAPAAHRSAPVTGHLRPLSADDMTRIDAASRDILEQVGLSDASPSTIEALVARGGRVTEDRRLLFPQSLVDQALCGLRRDFTLCGRNPVHDIEMTTARVHTGSGGASPMVVDLQDGSYRPATLADLYDAARLVDTLDNVKFFSRSMIAGDIETARDLDINTAYAALTGTSKHVMTSASEAAHVRAIAEMCFLLAGSAQAFYARPFLSLNINHAVPPLRFDPEACDVLLTGARLGLPVMVNTFGQMGASSPVTIAGCLAQTNAETLAGMVLAWIANPEVTAIYGARPMVTDLRSGGMAGGSGEQAILTAAATQMAQYYKLPNSTIAGATDSKIADGQAGYEKALSVTMAVQAGANLVTQAAGTQAGLMATSFEAYVIDNDMLGAILSAASPIEVNDQTLAVDVIAQTVRGEGHFLGHPETYARMKSDFVYPAHADRQAPEAWVASGTPTINSAARRTAETTLANHFPSYISPELDRDLRARFDIRLPQERMRQS